MGRPLSTEARSKAIDATRALVLERGMECFSVSEVAKRSGVAKTTIYRHWPDGHSLLVESLKAVVSSLPTPNTGSLEQDLLEFVRTALPMVQDTGMRSVFISMMKAADGDPEMRAIHDRMLDERDNPVRTIFQLAQARGELPADLDLDLAADFTEGPFMRRILMQAVELTDAEIVQLVRWIVAGLTAPTATSGCPTSD